MTITLNATDGITTPAETVVGNESVGGNLTVTGTATITGVLTASSGIVGAIRSSTAQASTSGTSIDFTSLPSGVQRITVMFNNVSSNGTSNYLVQIGTSGGIQSTGYAGYTSINTTNVTSTAGFIITASQAAAALNSGSVVLTLLDSSTGIWAASGAIAAITGVLACSVSGGAKTLSGTLDRVRITTVNGTDTFDAGSINILYE